MANFTIGLIGNPNCGKTTLFNALTGSRQRVGNWPGVTVEPKVGRFYHRGMEIKVIDLPGTYSTLSVGDNIAVDTQITCELLLSHQLDAILNIVDATNLERNLYLTTQLQELPLPMLVAVNMIDVAQQRGLALHIDLLAEQLDCPVVTLAASKGQGICTLKEAVVSQAKRHCAWKAKGIVYPELIETAITALIPQLEQLKIPRDNCRYLALSLLENDGYAKAATANQLQKQVTEWQTRITAEQEEPDLLIADTRYGFAHQLAHLATYKTSMTATHITDWLDRIVLHRVLGIPIFLGIIYSLFAFAINVGGVFQDCFDILSNAIFVQGLSHELSQWGAPPWLIAVLAQGAGKGISTTVTFIPVISTMFLGLAFLEDSGYMARAAFVMDRLMRALGLPGKAFVPMIVGFGCNVPAVMAARHLESKRDRILTVIMSPFMSCGARLAIFAVFTALFFPVGGQNIVFALYLIGIGIAFLTGLLLRRSILQGKVTPFVIELPSYHLPTPRALMQQTWQRLKSFILKAGIVIVPVCIVLGMLSSLTWQGTLVTEGQEQLSLIASLGRWLTPIFSPMGLQAENWPATVALITGTLAKEVVIGTLNTLYAQMGHFSELTTTTFNLSDSLTQAWLALSDGFKALPQAFSNPVLASAKQEQLTLGVNGMMHRYFDGQIGAFAYLLFTLLYIPCVSTTAAIARELNKAWAWFSVLWGAGVAYGTAVVFYQLATWSRHPGTSLWWVSLMTAVFTLAVWSMHRYAMCKLNKPDTLLGSAASRTPL